MRDENVITPDALVPANEERRGFLRNALAGIVAVYGLTAAYTAWRFLVSPAERRTPAPPMRIDEALRERIATNGFAVLKFGGKTVLLRGEESRGTEGVQYRAFNLRCTHAGCTVEWRKDAQKFVCPCHGAEFSANGAVTRLPATLPLEELRIVRKGEMLNLVDAAL